MKAKLNKWLLVSGMFSLLFALTATTEANGYPCIQNRSDMNVKVYYSYRTLNDRDLQRYLRNGNRISPGRDFCLSGDVSRPSELYWIIGTDEWPYGKPFRRGRGDDGNRGGTRDKPRGFPVLIKSSGNLKIAGFELFKDFNGWWLKPRAGHQDSGPVEPPGKNHRFEVQFTGIDDDVYLYVQGKQVFSRRGADGADTSKINLNQWLAPEGQNRIEIALGNGNCFGSHLNVTFFIDGKIWQRTREYKVALSHCGWQLLWEYIIVPEKGEIVQVK
jgi:hypothetical protein